MYVCLENKNKTGKPEATMEIRKTLITTGFSRHWTIKV